MPREGSAGWAQAHGVLMVQGPECRSPGSCPRDFSCHHAHSFTIFAAPRGGSEIAQTWGAYLPREPSAAVVRNCRESFSGRKAKGGLGFQAATCSITAPCTMLARLPLGAGASPPSRLTQRVHAAARCQESPGPPLVPGPL